MPLHIARLYVLVEAEDSDASNAAIMEMMSKALGNDLIEDWSYTRLKADDKKWVYDLPVVEATVPDEPLSAGYDDTWDVAVVTARLKGTLYDAD